MASGGGEERGGYEKEMKEWKEDLAAAREQVIFRIIVEFEFYTCVNVWLIEISIISGIRCRGRGSERDCAEHCFWKHEHSEEGGDVIG